ncbi:MAG: DNA polymerase III subunit delta [Hyphomicrobiaceae bacterium]
MVAITNPQFPAFLKKLPPDIRAFLLFGPDAGLIAERGQMLARTIAQRETPAGEILRLEDTDLESDPDRLAVELQTTPMFGGSKIIRTSTGRRMNPAVRSLMDARALAGTLIVEAGDLKREDSLKKLFEKDTTSATIACYPDNDSSLDTLVTEVLGAHGLTILPDARQEVMSRLGADRTMSRSEIEKLALYALGSSEIHVHQVTEIIGDAADLKLDLAISAAANGDLAGALLECDRACAAGENPQSLMLAAERHFHRLHRMRVSVDGGKSLDETLRFMRPPLPAKARDQLKAQARIWTTSTVARALSRITEAVKAARTTGSNETVLTERLLMEIARLARQGLKGGPRMRRS